MALRKQDTNPQYYYDKHPTHEDLMGESKLQSVLIQYLIQVFLWLYRSENWYIATNLNIYSSLDYVEYPMAPDVAVFKSVKFPEGEVTSWKMMLPGHPAPAVVFEICSEKTVRDDLEDKPEKYGHLGVKEYFAFDPHQPPLRKKYGLRLYGWRYNANGKTEKLEFDEQGRLWSEELESWLKADGDFLRLYDREGKLRLTGEEAEAERAEAEQAAKEKAWAKLRELGIDPESL